ncbi:PDR/VanB family oxidoreductase [Telluria mixta]|uniref:PDR/VanB family oxidoreductase n=1 Tax=Telluria mixta TaxID=34071 RepID=A0ABT2BS02_9BURK|nr:PDR/VanB family oxidoreductase [Telluria mixta]MCS0627894.1 PDR/VanB family oxidoreductase [Telluria mixta]WEM93987.1 PDR/VanB family oxidoreductase [Telluria mixta]
MTAHATIRARVVNKIHEAEDIVSIELAAADGTALPPFSAGSHIDVEVGPGVVRQYSLCNDPLEQHRYLIGVLREPQSRGGSRAVHDIIQVGDIIPISTPKNHFPLTPAGRYLLLAGGIGITPILSMAERLSSTDAEFTMHYCTRSLERTAFRERILKSGYSNRVRFHFDADAAGKKFDLAAMLHTAPPDTHLYVCGPAGFIEFVTAAAKAQGWKDERVHFEYFGAAPQDTTGDQPFEVRIASTGLAYTVAAGKTVIQVLEANGVEVPVSCEQGVCGTCVTRVLEGVPDHRDHYLTEDEHAANDQFTPCCSRSKSPLLVLDL